MTLSRLYFLIAAALFIRLFPWKQGRKWLLLVASIVLIYWLQPEMPIRYLDFYLPTFLIGIILLSWNLLAQPEKRFKKEDLIALCVIGGTVFAINLTRYINLTGVITPSRPPELLFYGWFILVLLVMVIISKNQDWRSKAIWIVGFISMLLILIVLKNPDLQLFVSKGLIKIQGQNPDLASRIDIQWLGFSYVVFRLIHTIKDYQSKRLKDASLLSFMNYILFFPTFTAGPIDRIQHFQQELRVNENIHRNEMSEGAIRLLIGIFKKFAIADTMAILALNSSSMEVVNKTWFIWLSLYMYAFLIYFDFSGYTDIAIGLGILVGIKLPENFNNPYLKPNLKLFWDNWHMTLTQWFRTYYFNPVSRKMRRKWKEMSVGLMVFIMQVTTMLLIGLWHGVTWNFVLWGMWHGLGMFVFNRWNEWFSPKKEQINSKFIKKAIPVIGIAFTFHYVAFGWIWFALPTIPQSFDVFMRLFGG